MPPRRGTRLPGTGARPNPVRAGAWPLPRAGVAGSAHVTAVGPASGREAGVASASRAARTAVRRAVGRVAPPAGRIRARNRRRTVAHRLLAVRLRRSRATWRVGTRPVARGTAVLQIRIAHLASVSFYGLRIARSGIFPRPGTCVPLPCGLFSPGVFAGIPRRAEAGDRAARRPVTLRPARPSPGAARCRGSGRPCRAV